MEKDDELKGEGNSINYEARMQDTRVGRFLSIDPLTKSFPHYSPYQFAGNTPIQALDLDGAEEYHYLARWDKQSGRIIFKLDSDKTVMKKTFLGVDWVPKLTYNVVYQNSNGDKSNYVFTADYIATLGGSAEIKNRPSDFKKFVKESGKVAYASGEEADKAFSDNDFISENERDFNIAATGFVAGALTVSSSIKTPVEENAPEIKSTNWDKRPKFRKATDKAAVVRATDGDGTLRCVKCETTLTGAKQVNGKRDYQLGHTDGNSWAQQKDGYNARAQNGDVAPRSEVNDTYQNNVEVECVNCNASDGGRIGNSRKTKK